MKKYCLILALVLLCSLTGCGRGEARETSAAAEKPAIYLYPDSSADSCTGESREMPAAPEKPAIYLYPENEVPEAAEEKPAIYLYPENSETSDVCEEPELDVFAKPAIYLAPEKATKVHVKLHFAGTLTCTYPEYKDGWTVWATPEGILTDENGREYNYLFWEGVSDADYDMSRGFVVAGTDTAAFLEKTLKTLGLNDREAGDFITYWLPRMQDNPYNLITFQQEAYTKTARLEITPEPDSLLRVFMAFTPLDEPIKVPEPELPAFERKGFAVIEWGGAEVG